jgi:hypothetical protein
MTRPLIALAAFLLATGAGAQTNCLQTSPITGQCMGWSGSATSGTTSFTSTPEPKTSEHAECIQ